MNDMSKKQKNSTALILDRIEVLNRQMNEGFSLVDKRLTTVEAEIGTLKIDITAIRKRVTSVDKKLTGFFKVLDKDVSQNRRRIIRLEQVAGISYSEY